MGVRPLTTWAQRERCWGRRCRWAREPQEVPQEEVPHERSPRARHLENVRLRAQSPEPFYLHKGDILESHPSGLGSWRVGESESLGLRPDTIPQGTAVPLGSPEDARLSVSLRETYQRNLRETSSHDRRSLFSSKASPLQVRRPRPASSFTSPFRFSSPSFPTQSLPCPPGGAPVTPSPTAEGSPGLLFDRTPPPGLTSTAGLSPAASPTWGQSARGGGAHSPEDAPLLRPGPPLRADPRLPPQAGGALERSPTLEDPVILSLARQSLREQTARLQADYESQISALQEKLSLANRPPSSDPREANQILRDRCENLERSVMETRSRARALEEQNLHLERQLSEWQGRYDLTSATVTTLHERLEAANQSCREKEAVEERLRARLQLLEEAQVQAYRLSDDTDAQRKQEHSMLRDLLVEYDTLGKDHERVKDKLVSTEDKLFDAIAQISELKRVVSKLESQVKQLEHESLKTRHLTRSQSQRSGAGLYHHPDLLLSPGRSLADLDTSSRRWADTGPALHQTAAHTSRHYPSPEKEEMPVAEAPPRREAPPGPLVLTEESRSSDGRGPPRPEGQGPLSSHSGRRGELMAPRSERSSPKRCPSENYSTAFGPAPSWRRHSHTWSDVRLDQRAVMSPSPSNSCNAKKRLQFSEETEANHQPSSGKEGVTSGADPIERAVGVAWEEHGAEPPHPYATPLSCHNRLQSLADTERLFDQLTLEKKQIESSLSRLPSPTGGRGTLQARLEEEALEARLEKVDRELGSIRMTLKRFHVLRSSTNN
ncbi:hypothetical protein COCON_G00161600 [Conger conger]|uniref:M-phase phosphoprotein 9 n=1 Tax=Conger conger TaxID=82655 RepID=A0A9Q1DAC9_CONCO|nr:hypothetical protein COCON_G00161600 [Conger conger]